MRRRTIQLGSKTLLVSLPHAWVSKKNVRKGDELSILETSDGLFVSTDSQEQKRTIVHLDAKDCGRLLRRIILGCYLEGVQEVHISHDEKSLSPLQDLSKEFIGFDIVHQERSKTVFQDFSQEDERAVEKVLARSIMVLKTMLSDGKKALRENDKEVIQVLKQLDITLNKTTHYCYRYSRKNKLEGVDAVIIPMISSRLEECGDAYKNCMPVVFAEGVRKEYVKLHDSLEVLFNAVAAFTLKRTAQHALLCADAYDSSLNVLSTIPSSKASLLFRHVLELIISIQSCQLGLVKEAERVEQ